MKYQILTARTNGTASDQPGPKTTGNSQVAATLMVTIQAAATMEQRTAT